MRTGTGVTGTDRGSIIQNNSSNRFGGGYIWTEFSITPDTAIADATNTGFIMCGLSNQVSAEATNGFYLFSANGETYKIKMANAGSRTTYDTGITPVLSTFIKVGLLINPAMTKAWVVVNGVYATEITTNIFSNTTSIGWVISACRTNTTAVSQGLAIDYLSQKFWS